MSDRFERPGSRSFQVLGYTQDNFDIRVLATITADQVRFEPGWITFWTGGEMEFKTLVATVKVDAQITGLVERPPTEEQLAALTQWQSATITRQTIALNVQNCDNELEHEPHLSAGNYCGGLW